MKTTLRKERKRDLYQNTVTDARQEDYSTLWCISASALAGDFFVLMFWKFATDKRRTCEIAHVSAVRSLLVTGTKLRRVKCIAC